MVKIILRLAKSVDAAERPKQISPRANWRTPQAWAGLSRPAG